MDYRQEIMKVASDKQSGAFIICGKILRIIGRLGGQLKMRDIFMLIDGTFEKIARAHAPMPSIKALLSEINNIAQKHADDTDSANFHHEITALKQRFQMIPDSIRKNAEPLIKKCRNIITLSNSGLVTYICTSLHKVNPGLKLFICESSPGREAYIMARKLAKAGIETTMIPDTAIASIADSSFCAVTGCDAFSPKFFRNKIGSYNLALVCREKRVKYHILADSYKFVKNMRSIPVVDSLIEKTDSPLNEYHAVFEDVPINLTSMIVTEKGRFAPAKIPVSLPR